jgi:hypothetical protein
VWSIPWGPLLGFRSSRDSETISQGIGEGNRWRPKGIGLGDASFVCSCVPKWKRRPPQKAAATQAASKRTVLRGAIPAKERGPLGNRRATAKQRNWRPYRWLSGISKTTFCRGGSRRIFDLLKSTFYAQKLRNSLDMPTNQHKMWTKVVGSG